MKRYVLAKNLKDAQGKAERGEFTMYKNGPFEGGFHLFAVEVNIECVDVRTVGRGD